MTSRIRNRTLAPAAAGLLLLLPLLAAPAPAQPAAGEEWKVPARAAKKKNPVPADESQVAQGLALYRKECLSCHGETGRGDGPGAKDLEKPAGNLADPKMWSQTDGTLFFKITEGRKPMPTFEKMFTDEQRWQIVTYVRTLAPKPPDAKD